MKDVVYFSLNTKTFTKCTSTNFDAIQAATVHYLEISFKILPQAGTGWNGIY